MEHVLADQGLRLACLSDPDRFDELEEDILSDGPHRGVVQALHPWRGVLALPDQDVIVLATGEDDGRPVGLVAASQRATSHEPFLLVEAACVSAAAYDWDLLQRLIAFSIISLVRKDVVPSVIAACSRSEAVGSAIRALGARFTAARVFPDPEAPAIDLAMACTARRIARTVRPGARYSAGSGAFYAANDRDHRLPQNTLVLLDLSASDEATIAADARLVIRQRLKRRPVYAADAAADWRGTKRPLPGVASTRSPSQISRPRS